MSGWVDRGYPFDPGGLLLGSVPAHAHSVHSGLAADDHTQYVLRSILTTNGDLFTRNAGVIDRIAAVAAGSMLRAAGVGVIPAWSTTIWPNALTAGNLLYGSAANTISGLASGSAGALLYQGATNPTWSNTPALIWDAAAGSLGIGTGPAHILHISHTSTLTVGTKNAQYDFISANPGAASSLVTRAAFFDVRSTAGNSQNLTAAGGLTGFFSSILWLSNSPGVLTSGYGLYAQAGAQTGSGNITAFDVGFFDLFTAAGYSGTITAAYGLRSRVRNVTVATITAGYAFYASAPSNSGGGAFTTYYGYYAELPTAAGTNWPLYVQGGTCYLGTGSTLINTTALFGAEKLGILAPDSGTCLGLRINAAQASITAGDVFTEYRSTTGVEGSVAGTAVAGVIAYNTFTGSHWSQGLPSRRLTDIVHETERRSRLVREYVGADGQGHADTEEYDAPIERERVWHESDILPGTVLVSLDEMASWPGEVANHLPRCAVSTSARDRRVYGVYGGHDRDGDVIVLGVGAGKIRVSPENGEIRVGDLLCSSSTAGVAMRWSPGDVAEVVAKARQQWKAGEGLIACTLMAG